MLPAGPPPLELNRVLFRGLYVKDAKPFLYDKITPLVDDIGPVVKQVGPVVKKIDPVIDKIDPVLHTLTEISMYLYKKL